MCVLCSVAAGGGQSSPLFLDVVGISMKTRHFLAELLFYYFSN